jgi:hypothetical protein
MGTWVAFLREGVGPLIEPPFPLALAANVSKGVEGVIGAAT